MNTVLVCIDGHTNPIPATEYPSGVQPLEWPSFIDIPNTETHHRIRSILFPTKLSRYAWFCRSVFFVLLIKRSSYAHLERTIDAHITYTPELLQSYMQALSSSPETLYTVCDVQQTMRELPVSEVRFEHHFPNLAIATALDRLAAFALMLALRE